jgi:photosystem II stability/assembly factor-like uncharacterized protein
MKKLYLIIFFVILIPSIIHSQWTNQNPVPDGNDLWTTFFVDGNTGWIVGSDGFIKKTTNAGVDWIQQNSGTTLTLRAVQFISLNTGWICGEGGLILKTTDSGLNWFSLRSGTTEQLTDIQFCDADTGYTVGYVGTILKTTNGGSVWVSQSSGIFNDLTSVDFINGLLGYTVGYYGNENYKMLKTTDGGLNWFEKPLPPVSGFDNSLNTVEFVDANSGWIGFGTYFNYIGAIFKTTNGGDNWTLQYSGFEEKVAANQKENQSQDNQWGIRSIFFKDLNNGYAVGGNGLGWCRSIVTTTNGGSTWIKKYAGSEEDGLLSVYVNNQSKGWAVGYSGVIFTTEDNGKSWAQILSGSNSTSLWSGDFIYSTYLLNENVGWAVGRRNQSWPAESGLILKTTNEGKIWKTQSYEYASSAELKHVYFINENIGWTVGMSYSQGMSYYGRGYYTTDGGEIWNTLGQFENTNLTSNNFYFINGNTGWMVDDKIYKTTDGATSWLEKNSTSCNSVHFTDINIGWVCGPGGMIMKSTDGGETWSNQSSGSSEDLSCIRFYDNTFGICSGSNGTILTTTDGGNNWNAKTTGVTETLNSIQYINSATAMVNGFLFTTDGGNSWEQLSDGYHFTNKNVVWTWGDENIFRYSEQPVPVELTSLMATASGVNVELNWSTATETNNQRFEVERMITGEEYEQIGYVAGFGTTTEPKSYSFVDTDLKEGIYTYRIKQIDFDGTYEYSGEVNVEVEILLECSLEQNYPNPFNPATTIKYSIPKEGLVTLKVYNVIGEEVATLVNEIKLVGNYNLTFDGENLSSGIYFYKLQAGDFVETKKMVFIK